MTEFSGQAGRMSNTEPPQGNEDEQGEYYLNDKEDTDSPSDDPTVPTAEGDSHENP